MKQKLNLLFTLLIIISMATSCKKEVPEKGRTGGPSINSAAIGEPDDYSEETLQEFVDDVVYYNEHPSNPPYLDEVTAINKMEATLNYVFSDLDTTFEDFDTVMSYTFSLTPNVNDEYSMAEIAETMYDIKYIIKDRMDDNIGSGLASRLVTCAITPGLSMYGYKLEMVFAKAKLTNPSADDIAGPTHVSTGSYVWRNSYNAYACITNTVQTLTREGSKHFLYEINMLAAQSGSQPYLDGIYTSWRTKVIGGVSYSVPFVDFSDVSSQGTTGFPTSMSGTPSGNGSILRPNANLMFVKQFDDYVTSFSNGTYYTGHDYCINQDYVNYYMDKIPVVFNAVRPNSDCYALGGSKFNVSEGYMIGGWVNYQTMVTDGEIYHQYYFEHTLLKWKSAPVWY